MSRLLRPLQIYDHQTIIDIITEAVDEIQSGATIVDTSLGSDEYGCIDLIAADRNKRGILFFITTSNQEIEFFRSFKCLCWYQENRIILQKLYSGVIDTALPPSIYFISPTYSDSIRKVLLNLKEHHVTLLKYTCFQDGESIKVLLEKIAALPDPPEEEKDEIEKCAEDEVAGDEIAGDEVAGDEEDEASVRYTKDLGYPEYPDREDKDSRENPADDTSLPETPSLRNQLEKWLRTSQSDSTPRMCPPDNGLQTSQPDRSPIYPPDKPPAGKSGRPAFDSAKFRQEIGFDISNISDEELHDLLLE